MNSNSPGRSMPRFSSRFAAVAGFLLIFALAGPFVVWRASWGSSLWVDEIYSLLLIRKPVGELVTLTAADAHPPLYYLVLKAWVALGDVVGFPRALLWARLPGALAWLGMLGWCWFGGRRLLGGAAGTLCAVGFALAAQPAFMARDVRNYALAEFFLVSCFFLLLIARDRALAEKMSGRRSAVALWCLYAFSAAAALWTHLLCGLILALFFVLFVYTLSDRRCRVATYLAGGVVAHVVACLAFMPWVLNGFGQFAFVQRAETIWMSEPTFSNWLSVFLYWFPLGRLGETSWSTLDATALGYTVLSVLPFALLAVLRLAGGIRRSGDPLLFHAVIGFLLPFVYTSLLWLLAFSGIAKVFHGERYPALAVPFWIYGLAASAILIRNQMRLGIAWAWLLVGPWLLVSVRAQQIAYWREDLTGISAQVFQQRANLPPPGSIVYTIPSQLAPYVAENFPGLRLRPIETLAGAHDPEQPASILYVRTWMHLFPPTARVAGALLDSGALDDGQEVHYFDGEVWYFEFHALGSVDPDAANRLAGLGVSGSVSVALPEAQPFLDGFHFVEVDNDGEPFVWGGDPEAAIRFQNPVDAGVYTLFLDIARLPYPEESVEMTISATGWAKEETRRVGAGRQILAVHVEVGEPVGDFRIVARHQVWSPQEVGLNAADGRHLTYMFYGAWLGAAGGAVDEPSP